MAKESFRTGDWPTPLAVRAGDLLFLSGTTSKLPTGEYLAAGDIEAQTHIVIDRIQETLALAGASLKDVVKVTAFILDIKQWSLFHNAYMQHFADDPPARTTIQAGGFEEGACVEIDVIALMPEKSR